MKFYMKRVFYLGEDWVLFFLLLTYSDYDIQVSHLRVAFLSMDLLNCTM
jgi:hypothetical protein